MGEDTVIVYAGWLDDADVPFVWYGDCNMVVLAARLEQDVEGRRQALDALQESWRASCLRLVPGPRERAA